LRCAKTGGNEPAFAVFFTADWVNKIKGPDVETTDTTSAKGQNLPFRPPLGTSGKDPKADIERVASDVRFRPWLCENARLHWIVRS
jgi:hypothetical protein